MYLTFNEAGLKNICDELASRDADLNNILQQYGYPPFWSREPGFSTMIHIILEQQVSLASAEAALNKLQQLIGTITPEKIRAMPAAEMKACYFSRQKIIYAKHLAEAVLSGQLSLEGLETLPDNLVKEELKKVKGIGEWTVSVYLMMAFHRTDCFPLGDVALVSSLKRVKALSIDVTKEELTTIVDWWKPYRTVAAFLLWHAYLSKRKMAKRKTG